MLRSSHSQILSFSDTTSIPGARTRDFEEDFAARWRDDKISIATILRAETIRAPIGAPIEVVIGLIVRDPEDIDTMIFRFYYTGIRVRDLKKSLDFYTGVIGLKVVGKGTMPHGGKYVHLRGKGSRQMLELNWYPEGSKFYSEYAAGDELDHLAFVVKDVKKAFKELIKSGAEPAISPKDSKGTEVYVKDPDGVWIELLGSG